MTNPYRESLNNNICENLHSTNWKPVSDIFIVKEEIAFGTKISIQELQFYHPPIYSFGSSSGTAGVSTPFDRCQGYLKTILITRTINAGTADISVSTNIVITKL